MQQTTREQWEPTYLYAPYLDLVFQIYGGSTPEQAAYRVFND